MEKRNRITEWPFELVNGCISAEAFLGDKRLRAHVDTGAGETWISDQTIERLGLSFARYPRRNGAKLPGNTGYCVLDRLAIGGLTLKGIMAHRLNMKNLGGMASSRDLIVGKSILQNFHTVIDYPARRMILATRRHRKAAAGKDFHFVELPFMLSEHLIVVEGRLGRRLLRICIDTGSSGGTISTDVAKELGLDLSSPEVESRGIEGALPARLCSMEKLRLGPMQIPFLWLHAHDYSHMNLPVPFQMLLGGDFLSLFRIGLDYRRRKVSFEFEGRREAP